MKINIIYIISILVILQACSPTNTKIVETTKEQQSNNSCTDSLFISFCYGINNIQFNQIANELLKRNILKNDSSICYPMYFAEKDLFDTSKITSTEILFNIYPAFVNDSLKSINLTFKSIENQIPKNQIGYYNIRIRKLYETKYGKPLIKKKNFDSKIIYIWQLENKTIQIIENFELKWDILEEKNYKVLFLFEIVYENKNYYNFKESQTKKSNKIQNDTEIKKQNKTLRNI